MYDKNSICKSFQLIYRSFHHFNYIAYTQIEIEIFIENSYISIRENIKSVDENSSPILGLLKSLFGQENSKEESRKLLKY